jgi:hypothetical protein
VLIFFLLSVSGTGLLREAALPSSSSGAIPQAAMSEYRRA